MSIKQKLEDNVVIAVCGFAISGFAAGWVACEKSRVENKNERIASLEKELTDQTQKLKDSTVALEPYRTQINELISKSKRLEIELENSKGNSAESQQAIESWKAANLKLQRNINIYTSNCGLIGELRGIEAKKDAVEKRLASAYQWDSEKPRIEDYKRQVGEYQVRLTSLQSKLTCEPKQ